MSSPELSKFYDSLIKINPIEKTKTFQNEFIEQDKNVSSI